MEIAIDAAAPLEEIRTLLREYPDSVPVPLEIADFEQWLAGLPGPYAPPRGALLVARANGASAGCVALRPLDDESAEIKRLYVRDAFRGAGVGRALVAELIALAGRAGYTRLRLDTHSTMIPAQNLYRSFGFAEIPPYWDHPVAGVVFFELVL
jgi:putative acetyltransferase